ncbi:MAG TPA: M2 family metallopeptidase [Thermoplasmata archaeon]|nr:M2 family metallopeptidase [Thermoplasmata archaeon]
MSAPSAGTRDFLDRAEQELLGMSIETQRCDWVYATYITPDTEALSSKANARLIDLTVRLAKESTAYSAAPSAPAEARKLRLLRLLLPMLAPSDPRESEELARLVASMSGAYAKGRHTLRGGAEPLDLQALSRVLAESRDPAVLEDAWTGWHRVGRSMRPEFERYVDLGNRGCRELGFADMGAMWRSKYDMEPAAFAAEVERLWEQVRPFYASLHAYVRRRLRETYGADRVPERGPIPAHLLGNMWAQSWEWIFPLVAPPSTAASYDLTRLLTERATTPEQMVRYAESFFVSLGLEPLPAPFWERSMLVRPRDREVVCHASAWDLDFVDDLRIKMCIEITGEDFQTIHHELGHNYYQRAYGRQPFLFRDSAHDGFHEAIGDTVGLSVTPEYLVRIGLLKEAPPAEGDLGLLLLKAIEKVAFLPFGLAVDRWRWDVFSGAIGPRDYNPTWWEVRRRYQGIDPPAARGPEEFDPGAKFHVPANVPYMRYFLAHILQFQFHRALVRAAGATEPLHRASIYGSKEAGRRLRATLEMGQSHEWPDALESLTGERRMDATALLEYFAPLRRWLDEQNRGAPVGW